MLRMQFPEKRKDWWAITAGRQSEFPLVADHAADGTVTPHDLIYIQSVKATDDELDAILRVFINITRPTATCREFTWYGAEAATIVRNLEHLIEV